MRFFVEMKLKSSVSNKTAGEGVAFIETSIFPTLERCKALEAEGTLVAGGPASGAIQLVLIVEARTPKELDETIASLPIWPLMETRVVPMTTFEDRIEMVQGLLDTLRNQAAGIRGEV